MIITNAFKIRNLRVMNDAKTNVKDPTVIELVKFELLNFLVF